MAESDNCYYFAQTDNPRDEHWRLARAAIAAMPGGGPGAWVPADHLAEANREVARLRAGREWRPIDSAQLAELREVEDRAWNAARELVRGTNADMCKTPDAAYRVINEALTNAVHNRNLRTLDGRVKALAQYKKEIGRD
jgi:hypothetical protein